MRPGSSRRGSARRPGRAGLLLAACLAAGLAPVAAPRAEEFITVRGSVTDEAGDAVPGHVVRLLKSRKILNLRAFKTRDQSVEDMRATTDAQGFFEFKFPVDPQFRYYYLRFYDPGAFDGVKYRLPDDRDVTRRVKQGRPVQAAVILKFQPDWPKVKQMIETYGAGSHVGQVLRALGLPTRRTAQEEGRELWEYDTAGVAYLIQDGKILETRRTGSGEAPARVPVKGDSEEHPIPAQRVDAP
jgi:hypothetical protein